MKRISVCIPTYNSSKYISETIRSVLDSTYPNFEVIVHDNASTDKTREIVESFDDHRIHFYQNENNVGVPGNWTCALKRATGDYVGVLFSDDLYGPFWLNLAVYILDKYPHIGWLMTAYSVIDKEGNAQGYVSHAIGLGGAGECNWQQTFGYLASFQGWSPVYIARRALLEEIGYYEDDFGIAADMGLLIRLASRYSPYYSDNPFHATYRLHDDSLSHSLQDSLWVFPEEFKILEKIFSDDALSQELVGYKQSCYAKLSSAVLTRSQELLAKGDYETAQQLIHIMSMYEQK